MTEKVKTMNPNNLPFISVLTVLNIVCFYVDLTSASVQPNIVVIIADDLVRNHCSVLCKKMNLIPSWIYSLEYLSKNLTICQEFTVLFLFMIN